MVIFDTNVLITFVTSDSNDLSYLRISNLFDELTKKQTVVGIAAPSWAEFLVKTNEATKDLISIVNKNSSIKILPFDMAAAAESAFILRTIISSSGDKRGGNDSSWQQIKFDRQILAIARVNQAEMIYTNDNELIKEANKLNIKTCKTEDLMLPQLQSDMNF